MLMLFLVIKNEAWDIAFGVEGKAVCFVNRLHRKCSCDASGAAPRLAVTA